jgi:hypothetical protein
LAIFAAIRPAIAVGISATHRPQDLMAQTLLRSLQSSPDALGGILQRLSDRLTGTIRLTESSNFTDYEFLENEADISNDKAPANETVMELVREAIDRIDKLSVDSKFNAFWNLLHTFMQTDNRVQRVCIQTDYLATFWYLAAAVESVGTYFVLHGQTSVEEVEKDLKSFANKGGVLLATRAVITQELGNQPAFSLTQDLVLYDVPTSNTALKETLAVWEPLARQRKLNVHVLRRSNGIE